MAAMASENQELKNPWGAHSAMLLRLVLLPLLGFGWEFSLRDFGGEGDAFTRGGFGLQAMKEITASSILRRVPPNTLKKKKTMHKSFGYWAFGWKFRMNLKCTLQLNFTGHSGNLWTVPFQYVLSNFLYNSALEIARTFCEQCPSRVQLSQSPLQTSWWLPPTSDCP